MDAKERYNAAAARHTAALQGFLDKHKDSAPAAQIAALQTALAQTQGALDKARADYDSLLNGVADYLESAAASIESADAPAPAPAQQ